MTERPSKRRYQTCSDPEVENLHACPGRCRCYPNHLCNPKCSCSACGRHQTVRDV